MENKTIKRILTGLTVVLMLIGVVVSAISIHYGDTPGERESKQLGIIAYNAKPTLVNVIRKSRWMSLKKKPHACDEQHQQRYKYIGWALLLTVDGCHLGHLHLSWVH